jgi:hypothetical protein
MNASAGVLYIAGASLELVGIVLVGSPDLFPQAARVSRWLRLRVEVITNRLMRLFGRPRHRTVTARAGVSAAGGLSASGFVSVSESASLDEKVAFLLRRDEENQRRSNALHARVAAIEQESPKRLEELRREFEQHVADALASAHEVYLPLRLTGAGLLVMGLGCATAANFVV